MLKKGLIGGVVMILAGCAGSSDTPTGSAGTKAPSPDHYLVFFEPNQSELDAEGQAIVREAVAAIEEKGPSKIEIVLPTKVPGAPDVIKGRYAAIQNIIVAAGMDPAMYSRVALASGGITLAGAEDRAEIRLIP